MSAYEEALYDDFYDEAEGAAEFEDELEMDEYDEFDDEFDMYDEYDEFDEDEAFFDEEYDEYEDEYEMDAYDEYDDYEEDYDEEDMMDSAMAFALDAEDTDEFFKKLWRGIKRVAKKAAPVIGKVARIAGPILRKIPHPYAQIAGRAAGLLGRLRAEGATEEEALEAFAEMAVRDKRAVPIVAGLTARTVLKSKGARMPYRARKKAVKDVKAAAKTLVRKRGSTAIRALPKIAKSVKRTAAVKGTPASVRPKVVKKVANKVAKSPTMAKKLSRPSMKAKRMVKKAGIKMRSYTLPGPARITISGV